MKNSLTLPLLSLLFLAPVFGKTPLAKAHEETIFLFENRKVVVAVPEGFTFSTNKDDYGLISIKLADPKDQFSLECRFLPDPDGTFASSRARKEKMVEMFDDYVGSSTEKGIQFEELEPHLGAGTYCVFTDSKLEGKAKLPPGEFLHLTAGLKAWPGVVTVFRFFSNDTKSPTYQSILNMLRDSVEERAVPLK